MTGFQPGKSVEIVEKRDTFSTTFVNPDGSQTTQLASMPVNFRDGQGKWQSVDNRVVRDGRGLLVTAANEWKASFEPMTPAGGVTVVTPDGTVRFAANGARPDVVPVVEPDGVSVRYAEVFAFTDLVYRVTGMGVEELLVLKSPAATPAVSFTVHGAQFDAAPGQLKARGATVGRRLKISAPETFDGRGRPVDIENQVFTTTDQPGNRTRVDIGVTDGYLATLSPEQFPLVVDPSITVSAGTSWVHSWANYSNTGGSYASFNDGYARIGNPYISSKSTVRWRSTAYFDYSGLTSDIPLANVSDATLTTTVVDGTGSGTRAMTVSWAAEDGWHYGRSANGGPYVSSALSSGTVRHPGALGTLFNSWTTGRVNGGVLLFTGDESPAYTFKKFAVTLQLTVNRVPFAPAVSVTRQGSLFTFNMSAKDRENDNLRFEYQLLNSAGVAVASGGTSWIAAGQLDAATFVASASASLSAQPGNGTEVLTARVRAFDDYPASHVTDWTPGVQVGNRTPGAATLISPADGGGSHSLAVTLSANVASDPDGDPLTYWFYYCTDPSCSARQAFGGQPTVAGGVVQQSVTFPSTFFTQQLWWGVAARDNWPVDTFSAVRSLKFTNEAPTAALVAPVNKTLLTSQMPTLAAVVSDGDAGDTTLNYRFELGPTDPAAGNPAIGAGVLAASPWASTANGSTVTFQVPEWLSSTKGYSWKVLVSDPYGATGSSDIWTVTSRSRLGADSSSPMQAAGPLQVNLATGNVFFGYQSAKWVGTVAGPMSVGLSYNSLDLSTLGLRGTYYVDVNNNNQPDTAAVDGFGNIVNEIKLVRTDSTPSFNWKSGSPGESVPADNFKVQWKGGLRVPTAGNWRFAGGSDDNLRITIIKNGAPQVAYDGRCACLGEPAAFSTATAIALSPTDNVSIQIDYTESTGDSYLEFRARRDDGLESVVYPDWFVAPNQPLPTGWTLSQDTGLSAPWLRVEVQENELVAIAADGSQTTWLKTANLINGATVASWSPPAETDDVPVVNADGTVTMLGADGVVSRFNVDGTLADVTTAADTLKPAGAKAIYGPGSDPAGQPRLVRLEDRLAASRAIQLRYNQAGLGPCPTAQAGFDAAAPAGMLCAIEYPDGTSTRLYYSNGLLARISDPGDEATATMTAAPEGRAVTDLVWSNGQIISIYTPANNDRINAQTVAASTIPAAERIPADQLRTDIAWSGTKPTLVTGAAPRVAAARPSTSVSYQSAASTSVAIAGISGTARTVTFDTSGRTLTDTDAVGRVTTTSWASGIDAVLRTTAGGRTTVNVYDAGWHLVDTFGPATTSCFTSTAPPAGAQYQSYRPNGTCTGSVAQVHTDYDHNLQGLQGTHWSTNNFTQAPVGSAMGPGAGGNVDYAWPDPAAPAGVTGSDNWSARYTGLLYPPSATSNYVFRLATGPTDAATLYINDVAQLRASPGSTDVSTGTIGFNSSAPVRIRIDFVAGTGTSSLRFGYGIDGGPVSFAIGSSLKPGFWYATRTTAYDTSGSAQVAAQTVSETRFDEGIDPVYGVATSTTLDPNGLALKTVQGFESPGAGSLLRRTRRTLPAFAAAATNANSTTYEYYAAGATVVNPCVVGAAAEDQGGLMRYRTDATPASGAAVKTEMIYDRLGRTVATRYAAEASWTCTSYDARGRVVTVKVPAFGSQPARTVTTTYFVNGDPFVVAATDPAGTVTTTVDALGRTVRTVDVWGVTTATVYDQAGRITSAVTTVAGTAYSSTMGYAYDRASRLTSQTLDGLVIATVSYSPDSDALDPGKMTTVTYPTGTGNGGNGTTGAWSYDPLGRQSSLVWRQSGTNALITSNDVTRSMSGLVLTDSVDGTLAWTYSYDAASRLVRATGSGHDYQYGFAASGACGGNGAAGRNSNRTSLSDNGATLAQYCYDNADRLTSTTQAGYSGTITYDSRGNTTLLASEVYGFDSSNRHVRTAKAGVMTVSYVRDVTDRLVARTETPNTGTAATVRYGYTGPGDTSDLTLSTSNVVLERVISLPGGASYTAKGPGSVWSYPNLHGDHVATANQTGVKQGTTVRYDPFGNLLAGVLPDNVTGGLDYDWLGQHQRPTEHAAGLAVTIEMGARPYNPVLGRFVSVDPVEGGTSNNYAYVDDPVNLFDLNGRNKCEAGWNPLRWPGNAAQCAKDTTEDLVNASFGYANGAGSRAPGLLHGQAGRVVTAVSAGTGRTTSRAINATCAVSRTPYVGSILPPAGRWFDQPKAVITVTGWQLNAGLAWFTSAYKVLPRFARASTWVAAGTTGVDLACRAGGR